VAPVLFKTNDSLSQLTIKICVKKILKLLIIEIK